MVNLYLLRFLNTLNKQARLSVTLDVDITRLTIVKLVLGVPINYRDAEFRKHSDGDDVLLW